MLVAAIFVADPLPLAQPSRQFTAEELKCLQTHFHELWRAKVYEAASAKPRRAKERTEAKEHLESLRTGGPFAFRIGDVNLKELKLRRVLTVSGSSLDHGTFRASPISIVDDQNIIVDIRNIQVGEEIPRQTVWISGVDVSTVTSDAPNVELDFVAIEEKPQNYTTVSGANRAVTHFVAIDRQQIGALWLSFTKEHAEQLGKEFELICKAARARKAPVFEDDSE